MGLEPGAVILIGVRQEEGIDVEPTLVIATEILEAPAELRTHVRRVVVCVSSAAVLILTSTKHPALPLSSSTSAMSPLSTLK